MAKQYTVAKGDSLWSMAQRYLGGGPRWPEISKYHNEQAARFGSNSKLIPITDDNLIYVGQTIMVPSRTINPDPGTGQRGTARTIAKEIDLKVEYEADEDKNPISYVPKVTPDYTVVTALFGKVTLEIVNPDRYRRNLQLVMSRDEVMLQQNLKKDCHQAYAALTREIEVGFDLKTNRVTLKTPIATHAKLGPYTLEAKVHTPNHLRATLKPQAVSGSIEKAGCKFKYTADIAFKVDVTLHPTPKGNPKLVQNPVTQEKPFAIQESNKFNSTDSMQKLGIAGTIMVVVYLLLTKGMPTHMVRVGNSLGPGMRMQYMYTLEPPEA